MEPIGNLNGVRCAHTHSVSDPKTAIASNHLRTRMLSKPGRQGCRLIVWQDVNTPANCQVNQQQAVTQRPSVQCGIIYTQLCRRRAHAELLTTQETAESIWTSRQTSGSRESAPALWPAVEATMQYLRLKQFNDCPEFDFEPCYWQFMAYSAESGHIMDRNAHLAHSAFDSHAHQSRQASSGSSPLSRRRAVWDACSAHADASFTIATGGSAKPDSSAWQRGTRQRTVYRVRGRPTASQYAFTWLEGGNNKGWATHYHPQGRWAGNTYVPAWEAP